MTFSKSCLVTLLISISIQAIATQNTCDRVLADFFEKNNLGRWPDQINSLVDRTIQSAGEVVAAENSEVRGLQNESIALFHRDEEVKRQIKEVSSRHNNIELVYLEGLDRPILVGAENNSLYKDYLGLNKKIEDYYHILGVCEMWPGRIARAPDAMQSRTCMITQERIDDLKVQRSKVASNLESQSKPLVAKYSDLMKKLDLILKDKQS